MKRKSCVNVLFIMLLLQGLLWAGTTGKITGKIVDAETGEALIGANIVVNSMYFDGIEVDIANKQGAVADMNGDYVILNVSPGTYALKATMMGYAPVVIGEVRVEIDRTTKINVELTSEAIATEEVVIVAKKEVIKVDVAASQKSVSAEEIKELPVSSVGDVIGMQAGITSGLQVRGGGQDQTLFMVDGITMRDERTNKPMSSVPLSAIQDVSVQTGGFSAEYNNVRSGVVNVVTKEGDPERYQMTFTYRNSPASEKHFGSSPYDENAFWLRPYLDDDVCWTGTSNGTWDKYTQKQYPKFDGWNSISQQTMEDDDPNNDLTPQAAQRLFKWQRRKQGDIDRPDYTMDLGFGGPVPLISKKLGNLRFFTSYRQEQNMYLYNLTTDGVIDRSWMMKLTSDVSESIKLSFIGIYGEMTGTATTSFSNFGDYYSSVSGVASSQDRVGHTATWRLFTDSYWSKARRFNSSISGKMTHILTPEMFYEFSLRRDKRTYHTGPVSFRDSDTKYEIFPGYFVNEAPYGFYDEYVYSVEGGMAMGGPFAQKRDESEFETYSAKADLTNQMNKHHQIKTGFEFVMNSFDLSFGGVNKALPDGNFWTKNDRDPYRLSFYVQDKLEYEGLIATIGLLGDLTDPTGEWYDVTPFDRDFFSTSYDPSKADQIEMKSAESDFTVSPRFAISHPISVNSKLYFNYGHFRQMPTSEKLYMVRRGVGDMVDYIGDPLMDLSKTISYELGYDHSIMNQYLVHLAGYYKDISEQEYWVRHISIDGKVNYRKLTNNSYEDIRGFEMEVAKVAGDWVTGNVNYEYRVSSSGHFGNAYLYENPADQRDYERKNPVQSKPKARPRIKAQLDLHTPDKFGPKYFDNHVLGGWHSHFIFRWTDGLWDEWNPNNLKEIQYNVQWQDYQNVDLKISKTFKYSNVRVKVFCDIYNLFNYKYFSRECFYDIYDYNDYMKSLHLPSDIADELGYSYIPGDDNPGDTRKTGVDFQPIEWVRNINVVNAPEERPIYYDAATKKYMNYRDGAWSEVSKSRMDKVLDDKAYIDMPNLSYFTFLNPRDIYFGINVTFDLK